MKKAGQYWVKMINDFVNRYCACQPEDTSEYEASDIMKRDEEKITE